MTDGAICGMLLFGLILLVGIVTLVRAWGEIQYLTLKAERHDAVMNNNLGLIESQERALKFSERRIREDYRRTRDDYRKTIKDILDMAQLMHSFRDDQECIEAMMAGYFKHVGVEPDVEPERVVFNPIDTK